MSKVRDHLLARREVLRAEILQVFADAEHWNRVHPDDEQIDADPDGEFAALLQRLQGMTL